MNRIVNSLVASFLLLPVLFGNFSRNPKLVGISSQDKHYFKPVVVLELFTSQGCSSCPPADELLGEYSKQENSQIIPLSFHVDYWDRLGWKDPFSNAAYSNRQKIYGKHFALSSIYTPQLIVNGEKELVGSDRNGVKQLVQEELQTNSSLQIDAKLLPILNGKCSVDFKITGNTSDMVLNIALVEKISKTQVARGENEGKKLENFNVVRAFSAMEISNKPNSNISSAVPTGVELSNMIVVLYSQNKNTLKIEGATIAH